MILEIRSEVNRHIEEARNNEMIGSSLDAKLELYCKEDTKFLLDKFSEELRFIFITSEVFVEDFQEIGNETSVHDMRIIVSKTNHQKCVRCWHSRPEVGTIKNHESICARCHSNIEGDGETRNFA